MKTRTKLRMKRTPKRYINREPVDKGWLALGGLSSFHFWEVWWWWCVVWVLGTYAE